MHHRHDGRRATRAPDGADQGFVANVAGRIAGFAAGLIDKAQADGLNRCVGRHSRLQQIGMKRQQRAAVAGRAFGKDRQHFIRLQRIAHQMHHAQGVAPGAALDIQRACCRGQRANQRPVLHVGFGDKTAVARRMQHGNVEPGNMVGHQQHRPGDGRLAANFQCNAGMAKQRQRPGLDLRALLRRLHSWQAHGGNPQTPQNVTEYAQHAPAAG